MDIFNALAEPTRRNIIEILAEKGQLSASDIYQKFDVSPQAVSQHLKVLREAQLVKTEKQAQKRIYTINTNSLQKIEDWTNRMRKLWNQRFNRLDKLIATQEERGDKKYGR